MKTLLSLLALLYAINCSYAQNSNPWPTSGNVGIGTTTPAVPLEIVSSTYGWLINQRVNADNPGNINGIKFNSGYLNESNKWAGISSVAENIYSNSTGLALYSGATERLRISGTGFVGIGTTTPLVPFHVVAPVAKTTTGSTGSNIASFISTNDFPTPFGLRTMVFGGNTTANRYVALQTTEYSLIDGGNINLQTAAGYVGIGTDAPNSMLQVDDGASKANIGDASGQALNYGTSYLGFNAARTGTSWLSHSDGSNNGGGMIYSNVFGDINFVPVITTGNANQTLTDADMHSRMALQITRYGVVRAKQIVVETTGWADYVFKPTYKLPSLSAVKIYIDQNRHLPEMPSEADVKEYGVNLGEMVKLQTKKIEELTLYLIEQNKQLQENKKENEALQQDLEILKKEIRKK